MNGGYLPAGMAPSGELTSYTPTLRERMVDALRRNLFSDDRAGQQRAERVMGIADLTPAGLAPMAYDIGREGAQGNYAGAGLNLAMAMAPMPKPKGIRAFHGSPHSFDRFSMDRIGTGEGAQAYGHGLYFAENEGVAKSYRDNLSWSKLNDHRFVGERAFDWLANNGIVVDGKVPFGPNRTLVSRKEMADKFSSGEWDAFMLPRPTRDFLEKEVANMGSMYEVNINADPNDFLDWDKPLSEQGQNVLKAFGVNKPKDVAAAQHFGYSLDEFGRLQPEKQADLISRTPKSAPFQSVVGESHYMGMARDLGGKDKASAALKQSGIPGIKYLDAGSRSKGDGSRNYVVFDDKLITILRKYGLAGLVPAGLLAANQDQGGQQ